MMDLLMFTLATFIAVGFMLLFWLIQTLRRINRELDQPEDKS